MIVLGLAVFGTLIAYSNRLNPDELENEMAGKPKKKSANSDLDTFRVGDVEVVITRTEAREVLQIDGRVEPFYKTEGGYRLKRDVFQKPAKSLRAAAERYLKGEAAR
jgi:hypothetical protein